MDTSLSYPYALVKHLIPKWFLFPVIISSSLLERLLTRFRSVFWGICVHSFIRAFLMFGAHAAFQFIVKVFSSVMLTSGLCGGQLWFSTPTFANYIWMELTFWTGALSFWNKFGPFLSNEMKSSCYCTERHPGQLCASNIVATLKVRYFCGYKSKPICFSLMPKSKAVTVFAESYISMVNE